MSNKNLIRDFLKCWQTLDADKLGAWFTEDGVYHNMPTGPVKGRANITEFIKGFTEPWEKTHWDVVSIVEEGELVIAERVDNITLTGGKEIALPCVGIFELDNGKISVWRDYFDLSTYMKGFEA